MSLRAFGARLSASAGLLLALAACGDATLPGDRSGGPGLRVPGGAPYSASLMLQDQAIDPNDTYVVSDATLRYTTYVQTSVPVTDPVSGQSTTELVLAAPEESVRLEAGYDAYDRSIVNTYELNSTPDPVTDLADEARTIKTLGAQHNIYDGYGSQLPVAIPAGAPANSPMEGLAYEGAQVTEGVLLDASSTEFVRTYSRGARFSVSGLPGAVEQLGQDRIRITATIAEVARAAASGHAAARRFAAAGAPQPQGRIVRTYHKRDGKYVLEELVVETEEKTDKATVRGRQEVRFSNVKWKENPSEDAKRKARRDQAQASPTTAAVPAGPRAYIEPHCLIDEYGNPCQDPGDGDDGGGTYTDPCAPVAGGQNVVLQHGILSNADTWKSTAPWLRCRYQTATEVIPSLASLDSHSSQSYDQMGRVDATGQSGFVFIGHSQGGLVSRYTAQRYAGQGRSHMVEGVVSVGTPHQGAILARNMKQGGVDGLYSLLGAAGRCGTAFLDAGCHIATHVTQRLLDGWISGMMNALAPATMDLQPGSPSVSHLNSQPEGFARYGIQHYPTKRWMPMRLMGDMGDQVKGPDWVRYTEWAYQGLRVCNYASIFFGQFWLTQACGSAHRTMDSTDRWWDRMTAPGMKSDGIVHGPSQVYPGALEQLPIDRGESHVGETKSTKTRDRLDYLLPNRFNVARRQ
ncbi:MAG: alpha/beta fold hydrolase [Gemmatimonadota bacterium]